MHPYWLLCNGQAPASSVTLRIARARSVEIPALESCSGASIVVAKQVRCSWKDDPLMTHTPLIKGGDCPEPLVS